MRRSLVSIALMAGFAVLGLAATPEEEIRSAEKAWAAAVKGRDLAALDKIFTTGLIYAHATGAVQNKQQYIDRLKSRAQRYDVINHEDTKVVIYGDSAVAHSTMRTTGVNDAGKFDDHVMVMHFWLKQGGAWKLAGHQSTKVP